MTKGIVLAGTSRRSRLARGWPGWREALIDGLK